MRDKSNVDPAIAEIADKWVELEDEIDKQKTELKDLKARAKSDGFNLVTLRQIVKETRRGAKYQAEQLTLELELGTYRKAYGLPTELQDAQERARREAEGEGRGEESAFGERDTVQFGDGPEVPAREFERAAKGRRRERLQ